MVVAWCVCACHRHSAPAACMVMRLGGWVVLVGSDAMLRVCWFCVLRMYLRMLMVVR